MQSVEVALVPLHPVNRRHLYIGYTDARGKFAIERVPQGEYILGANREPLPGTFTPGLALDLQAARTVQIESAQKIAGLVLRLPPASGQRTTLGSAFWSDATPAAGAWVELRSPDFPNDAVFGSTDENGAFAVTTTAGHPYHVRGWTGMGEEGTQVQSNTVELGARDNGPADLILPRSGKLPLQ